MILWLIIAFLLGIGCTLVAQWVWREKPRLRSPDCPYHVVLGDTTWKYHDLGDAKRQRTKHPGSALVINGVYRG